MAAEELLAAGEEGALVSDTAAQVHEAGERAAGLVSRIIADRELAQYERRVRNFL